MSDGVARNDDDTHEPSAWREPGAVLGSVRIATAAATIGAAMLVGAVLTGEGAAWGAALLAWPASLWTVWAAAARGREDPWRDQPRAGWRRVATEIGAGAAVALAMLCAGATGEWLTLGADAATQRIGWTLAGALSAYALALASSRAQAPGAGSAGTATVVGMVIASAGAIGTHPEIVGQAAQSTSGWAKAAAGHNAWWSAAAATIVILAWSSAAARQRRGPSEGESAAWRWAIALSAVGIWVHAGSASATAGAAAVITIALLTPLAAPVGGRSLKSLLSAPVGASIAVVGAASAATLWSGEPRAIVAAGAYAMRDLSLWVVLAHIAPAKRPPRWLWVGCLAVIWGAGAPILHALGVPSAWVRLVAVPWNAVPEIETMAGSTRVLMSTDAAWGAVAALGVFWALAGTVCAIRGTTGRGSLYFVRERPMEDGQ